MKDRCWLIKKTLPVFILLGRFGDIIQTLPGFREIARRTGQTPILMVSNEYASVLDGVSYVMPWNVPLHWWTGMDDARQWAADCAKEAIVLPWWHLKQPDIDRGTVVIQSHGKNWGVNIDINPNYGTSMFRRMGFSAEEMMSLPLVFDRRNLVREDELAKRLCGWKRPVILYNFHGVSSPFGFAPEVLRVLNEFRSKFELVNLGNVNATRIYDLLGLYDRAVGLVTSDTATLHLAATGTIPYVAYCVPGWSTSVPKGRVELALKYDETRDNLWRLRNVLEKWSAHVPVPRLHPVLA